jgi:Transglutaminase-like superfamily
MFLSSRTPPMDRMPRQAQTESPPLSFYRAHGALSDPGVNVQAVDALPDDLGALAGVVRGLLIHGGWLHLYGLGPGDLSTVSRETLPVARRLQAMLAAGPLAPARPAARRAPATCRDYALMLCAFLRQKAMPARVRCGFARYFERGRHEDHWVCEYWNAEQGRWALADAQLDEAHCAHLQIRFDTLDLPGDQFVFAAEAWRRCRDGVAAADSFGHGSEGTGAWFLRVNLVRDLLSLDKREVSAWDGWRAAPAESRDVDSAARAWCDEVAAMLSDVDGHLGPIRAPPERWDAQLRPFWRI